MKKRTGLINCIFAAFAAYSKIPVPEADWDDEDLKWMICCFPLVGIVLGVIWCAAALLLDVLAVTPVLSGAVLTVLPLLVTGGIHMDGFLDTSDAVHSWKDKEEKLRILDDPHIGAFALICGLIYMILAFGLSVQLVTSVRQSGGTEFLPHYSAYFMAAPCFILSRVFSAVSVIRFPKAKKNGMLRTAADSADKRSAMVMNGWLAAVVLLFAAGALILHRPEMILLPLAAAAVFAYYHHMAVDKFGGVSGDLAGWFLEVCELFLLAFVVICCLF